MSEGGLDDEVVASDKSAQSANDSVRVVYVAGYGRSGSTLLDRLLGQAQGFLSAGELRHIWVRGFQENQLCGCQTPLRECGFWMNVAEEAFGSLKDFDLREVIRLQSSVVRARNILGLAFPALMAAADRDRMESLSEVMSNLYRAIRDVSGAKVIIDSSKVPHHGLLLAQNRSVELDTVHLVRDSRAVVHSWKRRRIRPEVHWKEEYMPVHSTLKSSTEWASINALAKLLQRRSRRYVCIRYEDLVQQPKDAIAKILDAFDVSSQNLDFIDGRIIELGLDHTSSGNPIRFRRGALHVRPDREWESSMKWRQKLAVTALTWPLLLQYGYRLFQ